MADVEMKDATPAEGKAKVPVKASKGGPAEAGENKKRFEVKKVSSSANILLNANTNVHSGMLLLSGLGILSWTTVLSAGTTLWICVSRRLSRTNATSC